jgi:hypothetical protein
VEVLLADDDEVAVVLQGSALGTVHTAETVVAGGTYGKSGVDCPQLPPQLRFPGE